MRNGEWAASARAHVQCSRTLADARPLPGNAFKVPLARNLIVRTLLDLMQEEVQP